MADVARNHWSMATAERQDWRQPLTITLRMEGDGDSSLGLLQPGHAATARVAGVAAPASSAQWRSI